MAGLSESRLRPEDDSHPYPETAGAAVLKTLEAIEGNPYRLGKPLRLELEGHRVAGRGRHRAIYRIDATERTVDVVAISHRGDVHRTR